MGLNFSKCLFGIVSYYIFSLGLLISHTVFLLQEFYFYIFIYSSCVIILNKCIHVKHTVFFFLFTWIYLLLPSTHISPSLTHKVTRLTSFLIFFFQFCLFFLFRSSNTIIIIVNIFQILFMY